VAGDGKSKRSYLFGADLAIWLLYILVKGKSNISYNVGSDDSLTIRELAFRVRDLLAPNLPVNVLGNPGLSSSVGGHNYVPDISRARTLGCQPWTSLSESLRITSSFLLAGDRANNLRL
jgi:dTDP-glucose 4,6-dehydratase